MKTALQFPIFGTLWGILLVGLAFLEPAVSMIVSLGSLMFSVVVFAVALLVLSPQRKTTLVPRWNFLTINAAATDVFSLLAVVVLALLFSNGAFEFEMMPVPT